jgi:hypothetical protein
MADPKEFEKILRGPHQYVNGSYVAIPYVHQEYPKTMDGTSSPASMVNSKAEEVAWIRRRKQRINNALKSAVPHFLRQLGVMIFEAFFRSQK